MMNLTKGVALLHFGRVGSTLLSNMIAQNKSFHNDGEVFEKIRAGTLKISEKEKLDPGKVIKHRRRRYFYRDYLISIKPIPEEHLRKDLLHMSYDDLLDTLENSGVSSYIIIKRKNFLKQVLSLKLAQQWKKYHFLTHEKPEFKPVHLDLYNFRFGTFSGDLIELFNRFDKYHEEMEIKTKNALVLNYEEDVEIDPFEAYNKVKKYLNLKKERPNISLSKSNIFRKEDVIKNFNEVSNYLTGTSYEWMLKNY